MANYADILSLFDRGQQYDQPFDVAMNMPQAATPKVAPQNLSTQIQEVLGAKKPDNGGQIGEILSSRFTQGDANNALLKTLYSGNYTSPGEAATTRNNSYVNQMNSIANIQKLSTGGNLPAALQLANEYRARVASGDIQGANLIMQFAKTQDKGLQVGANGQFTPLPGYAPAVADIEGAKAGAKSNANNASDLSYGPRITAANTSSKLNAENITSAQIDLPKTEANARQMMDVINNLKTDTKGLRNAVGFSSMYPTIAGGPAANFEAQLGRLRGATFLQAFQALKGGGAITEVEGTKAENAIAALQTNQSEDQFKKSLADLEDVINTGLQNARNRAGMPGGNMPTQPQGGNQRTTSSGITYTVE